MAPRPHEWRGHSHNTPDSSLSLSPQTRLLICQRHEGRGHSHNTLLLFSLCPRRHACSSASVTKGGDTHTTQQTRLSLCPRRHACSSASVTNGGDTHTTQQTRLSLCPRRHACSSASVTNGGDTHTTHSSSSLSVPADTPAHLPASRMAGTHNTADSSLSVPADTPAHLPASRMAGTHNTRRLVSLCPRRHACSSASVTNGGDTQHTPPLFSLSPQTRLLICQRHEWRGHTTHSSSFLSVPADTPAHLPASRMAGTLTPSLPLLPLTAG